MTIDDAITCIDNPTLVQISASIAWRVSPSPITGQPLEFVYRDVALDGAIGWK